MKKFAFFFCTRQSTVENTLAFKSLKGILEKIPSRFNIIFKANNTDGLSKAYNDVVSEHKSKYDYIVFLHDDVFVDDVNVCDKLERAHSQFDIVGLAGGLVPQIKQPALWHLMCGGFGSGNLRGAVAHPASKDQIMVTNFGPTPSRVAILDGLFISIDVRKVQNVGWKFNENYSFHHYDIASSIDANKKKLKLGVAPIWVMHSSPGLLDVNDKLFSDSQIKFLSEYSNC